MEDLVREGCDVAGQLAMLPLKLAREAFQTSAYSKRPLGEVMLQSLQLGERLVRLPFDAAAALTTELRSPSDLERRVAHLEAVVGSTHPNSTNLPEDHR